MATKLLIVDDEPITRTMFAHILETKWDSVLVASSGEEAWELLNSDSSITVALVDWILPGISGPELCKRVRAECADRYVYLMLVTGKDTLQEIAEALQSGADMYVKKPVTREELISKVEEAVRMAEAKNEALHSGSAIAFLPVLK